MSAEPEPDAELPPDPWGEVGHSLHVAHLVAADPWADLVGGLAKAAAAHHVAVTLSFAPYDPLPEAE